MVAFTVKYDVGIGAFSVNVPFETAVIEVLDTHVKEREDTSFCLFASKLDYWENAIQALMQLFDFKDLCNNKCIINVSDPHFGLKVRLTSSSSCCNISFANRPDIGERSGAYLICL
ncbi:unnamed protein product [Schistocephalus solidus]|uniref:Calpain catalytic domain-containing protein n=1 Tax=Schistocephalus solidus TaxID=70667 RepID=A0A183TI27_SCHSO|nr:unnamed protein product [Schistocephalus solidus]